MNSTIEIGTGIKSNYLSRFLTKNQLGKVHALFRSSFTIKWNDQLVHVGSMQQPLSAYGLAIAEDELKAILAVISLGAIVRLKEEVILVYAKERLFRLPTCDYKSINLNVSDCMRKAHSPKWHLLKTELEKHDLLHASAVIQNGFDRRLVDELMQKEIVSTQEANHYISHFWGRGIGLTPSGDDFLIGYGMMQAVFFKQSYWMDALRGSLDKKNTTDVSEHYYISLLDGYISAPFLELIRAASSGGEQEQIAITINKIMQFGHTSGLDTLLGIYTAICGKEADARHKGLEEVI
ncbi:DUF2877 domain-containing protein [Trichococcus paludicola]|uniref:DUF2877 domain-containing protein n=1 Tax=Trichococcus paludicola TaxID=2052942 RepID=UPI000D37AC2A|nr:DUF2877 domain-containing protein [Trichococcus paludicola]